MHIAIHYWPRPFPEQRSETIGDRQISVLSFSRQSLQDSFPVSFDAARKEMERVFGAHTEGDGSFGFSQQRPDGKILKAAGTIFEKAELVGCVDVWMENGTSKVIAGIADNLNTAIEHCVIQLLEHGFPVAGPEFCRWLDDDGTE